MKDCILYNYSIDVNFNQVNSKHYINVTTIINNEKRSFTIQLQESVNKYCIEELFEIIKNNYIANLTSVDNPEKVMKDILNIHKYLFIEHSYDVKRIIEDRWLRECHKGRVYCGEHLDLAITPLGSIYRNSKRIETITDVGSWEELYDSDCLKGKSAKEVYNQLEFDLSYAGWLFNKNSLKELAELYTNETLDDNEINTNHNAELLNELLNDEEKLDKLIRRNSSKEVRDLLDSILGSTRKLLKNELPDNTAITSMNAFD